MSTTIVALNTLAKNYLINKDLSKFKPISYTGNDESITLVPDESMAFTLNPPNGRTRQEASNFGERKIGALIRTVVSFSQARNMISNDGNSFDFQFSLILNNMLLTAVKYLGNLESRTLTLARPTRTTEIEYFSFIDTEAGYELRLFIAKKE